MTTWAEKIKRKQKPRHDSIFTRSLSSVGGTVIEILMSIKFPCDWEGCFSDYVEENVILIIQIQDVAWTVFEAVLAEYRDAPLIQEHIEVTVDLLKRRLVEKFYRRRPQ